MPNNQDAAKSENRTLPESSTPSLAPDDLRVSSYGISDIGQVRKANEDQFAVCVLRHALDVEHTSLEHPPELMGRRLGYLFVVADGVGGSVGGRHASALAVKSVESFILKALDWCNQLRGKDAVVLEELQSALMTADHRVMKESADHPELHGMGTTLTVAYFRESTLFVAHVGDSRCYMLRDGRLFPITRDHTVADEMAEQGMIKPDEVDGHPMSNVITNVVGGTEEVNRVDVHKIEIHPEDRVFLCTDGLTKMVKHPEIQSIIVESPDPETACSRLVALANERGGRDNITVVLGHFQAQAKPSSDPSAETTD